MIRREDLQHIDFSDVATGERLQPVHPGELLREDFLKPPGVRWHELALQIGVPSQSINEILLCRLAMNADTALRLARYFGTTAAFWMNLQSQYDLETTRCELGRRLFEEVTPRAA